MSVDVVGRFLIYGLRDPRTQEIRYVGKSARGVTRPLEHFPPPRADNTYKAHWLRKLISIGLTAKIVILEMCAQKDALSLREQFWIAIGRAALGVRFTNLTAGGDGCVAPTPETRARMSAAISATKNRPEVKARISKSSKEISSRPEVRAKKSVGMRKAWLRPGYAGPHNAALKAALNRPDVQNRHSEAAKAAHARPAVKERHRAALRVAATPEIIAKRAVGIKEALHKPEVNARLRAALKKARAKVAANSRAMWARYRAAIPHMLINLLSDKTCGINKHTLRRRRRMKRKREAVTLSTTKPGSAL